MPLLRRYDAVSPEDTPADSNLSGNSAWTSGLIRLQSNDRPVELTPREIKLLAFLMQHPGRVYSRDQLLDYVWGDETFVEPRTVDVHISRLRGIIEKDKDKPPPIFSLYGESVINSPTANDSHKLHDPVTFLQQFSPIVPL